MSTTLRLILGDQLNRQHSWFQSIDNHITYVFIECYDEATYAPHHIQKIVGIFAGMRAFAQELRQQGHQVIYRTITQSPKKDLLGNLEVVLQETGAKAVDYQQPDEYRLAQLFSAWAAQRTNVKCVESEHFIDSQNGLARQFAGKKTYLMETFYRRLRCETGLLMDGDQPHGGKWNFDAENRKKLPKNHQVPPPYLPSTDISSVWHEVQQAELPFIGELGDPKAFYWPTTPEQAWEIFEHWLTFLFPLFGAYQDAMTTEHWALYHSRISFALNTKMISPLEVCKRAEAAYRASNGAIPINAAEGFIRQILGWREFMRGVYWARMPEFESENYFQHNTPLPRWFWDGKTKMACQAHAIGQSLQHAYAHHIQRLMVTGNFALLAGVDPDEVDRWYLGIYIDAFQWVEITNTRGMSQYADGGWIATKPYVASANYMQKMGDYCQNCSYNPKTRAEENSCPLNALYWDFFDRHKELLGSEFRLGMVYRTLNKFSSDDLEALRKRASWLKEHLNEL